MDVRILCFPVTIEWRKGGNTTTTPGTYTRHKIVIHSNGTITESFSRPYTSYSKQYDNHSREKQSILTSTKNYNKAHQPIKEVINEIGKVRQKHTKKGSIERYEVYTRTITDFDKGTIEKRPKPATSYSDTRTKTKDIKLPSSNKVPTAFLPKQQPKPHQTPQPIYEYSKEAADYYHKQIAANKKKAEDDQRKTNTALYLDYQKRASGQITPLSIYEYSKEAADYYHKQIADYHRVILTTIH